MNSHAFLYFVSHRTQLAQSFEVGLLKNTPIPEIGVEQEICLARLALELWMIKFQEQSCREQSAFFRRPSLLAPREIQSAIQEIDSDVSATIRSIDQIAFELWGFSERDRFIATTSASEVSGEFSDAEWQYDGDEDTPDDGQNDDESSDASENDTDDLLADAVFDLSSWAVGVAFGRFNWREATYEDISTAYHSPFSIQPKISRGSVVNTCEAFHANGGILTDDPGHSHDLPGLMEAVLTRVQAPVPPDLRRWLQRDFFPFHLQRYSKSRRKAPIYWPLATSSGSYTLWLYYPSLTSQTLYTAVNDFVEPKLKQVTQQATTLRTKASARTRDEDRTLETLLTLEAELIELRDTMLRITPDYHPNHDDGVQITAAPLWPLFRHKPWQKLLKETWAKLENGDYDWAHLAMSYRPDEVREKCKTDKSLAIAHDLEQLYIEPPAKPAKPRGRKKGAAA